MSYESHEQSTSNSNHPCVAYARGVARIGIRAWMGADRLHEPGNTLEKQSWYARLHMAEHVLYPVADYLILCLIHLLPLRLRLFLSSCSRRASVLVSNSAASPPAPPVVRIQAQHRPRCFTRFGYICRCDVTSTDQEVTEVNVVCVKPLSNYFCQVLQCRAATYMSYM